MQVSDKRQRLEIGDALVSAMKAARQLPLTLDSREQPLPSLKDVAAKAVLRSMSIPSPVSDVLLKRLQDIV